jgi:hypothetical protein
MAKSQETAALHFNKHRLPVREFNIGQKVWLSAQHIKTVRPSKKLDHNYLGPFPIAEKLSSHAYRLTLPSHMRIHNVFHISLLEPVTENTIPNRQIEPPPPIEVESELEYEVSQILDSKIDKRKKEKLWYLVEWEGYEGAEKQTWQPASDLENCQEYVDEFHGKFPSKPGPHSVRDLEKKKSKKKGTANTTPPPEALLPKRVTRFTHGPHHWA